MSSQPNEKPPEIPDALVQELLRSRGVPLDAHVKVNVTTTRVRLNPDGTRTLLSRINSSSVGRGFASMRRPSKLVAIVIWALGFLQLANGMWAGHSDALAARIIRDSESCQLQRLMTPTGDQLSPSSYAEASPAASCQVEKAIVVDPYASSSRYGTTYHVVTLRPDGARDNTPLTARGVYQFWKRLRPTELIVAQRFVVPGYHLTGKVLALADSAGTAMSRDHPNSGAYPNAVALLMGGTLFAVGMAMFVNAARVAPVT
jgi:hypothetical protein